MTQPNFRWSLCLLPVVFGQQQHQHQHQSDKDILRRHGDYFLRRDTSSSSDKINKLLKQGHLVMWVRSVVTGI